MGTTPKGLGWGYFLCGSVPPEPQLKRAVAFIDGQNLFHSAREVFGHSYPNYDPKKPAAAGSSTGQTL